MDPQRELDNQNDSQPPIKLRRSNSPTSSMEDDEAAKSQRMTEERFETLVNEITKSVKVSTITLEGDSLSERQRKLNAAVNEAYKKEISLVEVLSSGEQTDLDNIYKIDLASKYRNVDYIIQNLKSTDSLRVNRALKAHWLFTDDQYSHIINPTYIYTVLQPLMSDKAFNKLLSQLAYHLKDEKCCEDFYMHCREMNDERYMKKFFLNCSVDFIKEKIANKDFHISPEYLSLLSRKSIEIVIAFIEKQSRNKISQQYLKELRCLIDGHGEFYLDLLEDNLTDNYISFRLGQRVTREILRNHKKRIFQRPLLYLDLLHYKQLIHALSHNDIRELASLIINRRVFWTNSWLKKLLNLLPDENRYIFIKSLYEQHHPGEAFAMKIEFTIYKWYENMSTQQREEWALEHVAQRNEYLGKLYQWYTFVSFEISFIEFKKLLRAEPDATERQTMFEILVSTCNEDESNITKLLKYFHDRHINEIILFKQHIIAKIMDEKNICKCGNEVWNVLNEILLSMRIYEDVNECSYGFKKSAIAQAMVHHIIYDKPITEKMLKLYEECYSMLSIAITTPGKEKVFEFVQNWIFATKIDGENLRNSKCLGRVVRWADELINIYRNFEYQPQFKLINLIQEIREHDINYLSAFLLHDEAYEKYFRDEIWLPTAPKLTEVICLQKLKKDITLLNWCKGQFTENIRKNKMRYKRFLSKIRIYFDEDLAPEWRKYFFENFKKNHTNSRGCAGVIFGLTILLPAPECEKLIKEYQPKEVNLVWSETDPCLVHIQNNIVKFMHLVRPTVNYEYLTSYAKGDFRRHSFQPIVSLSRQLPIEKCREFIIKLTRANSASIIKQSWRLAFQKLSVDELLNIFNKFWIKTQNATIVGWIHHLLVKAKDDVICFDISKLLSLILTQLHRYEHLTRIIDPRKHRVCQVRMSVRPQYCTAYWHLLQSVPISEQIWSYRETILHEMCRENMINLLDEAFLKDIIFKFLDIYIEGNKYCSKKLPKNYINSVWELIATFIVRCETKDIAERRKDVFMKVLQYFFLRWNNTDGYFYRFLVLLISNAQTILNENKFYNPLHLFEYICDEVSKRWPQREFYEHRLWLKFTVTLIKSLQETKEFKTELITEQGELWAEIFGKHCIKLMRSETAKNYQHLPQIFRHHFMKFVSHESHSPYGYDNAKFFIGVSKSFLAERVDLDCCILAVECLVKVNWVPENAVAESMFNSIRAMDIPELNYYIETKVGAQSNPFK